MLETKNNILCILLGFLILHVKIKNKLVVFFLIR